MFSTMQSFSGIQACLTEMRDANLSPPNVLIPLLTPAQTEKPIY